MGGCGSKSDQRVAGPVPAYQQPQPQPGEPAPMGGMQQVPGWGGPANQVQQVVIQPPSDADTPFMRTVAPSGTTWGQYVRTGASFVDPSTQFLAGPWAECISWAVIFEHKNPNWEDMPEYKQDGVVGGVLNSLKATTAGRPNQQQILDAADRLEESSHELMNSGQPLPVLNQVIQVPENAVPGQMCPVPNSQTPGTMMNVQIPPNAQPGQPIMAQAPIQPQQEGGWSTGGKVAMAAGGVVVAGGLAGAAYYATVGGGMEGFTSDMAGAGEAIGEVAGDVGEWGAGAVESVGDFGGEAIENVGDFMGDMF